MKIFLKIYILLGQLKNHRVNFEWSVPLMAVCLFILCPWQALISYVLFFCNIVASSSNLVVTSSSLNIANPSATAGNWSLFVLRLLLLCNNCTRNTLSCYHEVMQLGRVVPNTKQYNLALAKWWVISLAWKVTAVLVESSGSLPPGLWLMLPVGWLPRNWNHLRAQCS